MRKETKLKIIHWLFNGVTYEEIIKRLDELKIVVVEEDIDKLVENYKKEHLDKQLRKNEK